MLVSGAGGALVACLPIVIFCGLLRPLRRSWGSLAPTRRAEHKPPPSERGDRLEGSAISLNSIELALIAELNLEQARGHEAVANDPETRPERRRAAAQAASEWRARASLFQLQAQRQSAQPLVPGGDAVHRGLGFVYAGPERRQRTRRTWTRRAAAVPRWRERRNGHAAGDRRRGDRRRPELARR
jgi:hypothetical protein